MDSSIPGSSQTSNASTLSSFRLRKDVTLEHKRTHAEMSCAECHRLKIKCNRKVPCSTCIRRGCQAICPTGSLPSKYEQIAIPDSRLRKKVTQMSKRIRQLEDALKILQARVSSDPHPLLANELLEIKKDAVVDDSEVPPDNTGEEICDDFGKLTITEEGRTDFIGRSGGDAMVETVYDTRSQEVRSMAKSKLPPEITHVTTSFPFSPVYNSKETVIAAIESRLPSFERATALVEAYLQHITCFFRPVQREQIMEELIPKFFKRNRIARDESASTHLDSGCAEIYEHQLALLLAVFACGAAGDLTLEACNEEGETFLQLARSALSLHSVFEGTSLATVQAVALIGAYDVCSASIQTIESPFKMLTLALSLGITIGLHWDPSSWNIELKFVQRRRSLFWELYQMEAAKSLVSGRPMMLRLSDIDCKLPDDDDVQINEDGTTIQGFWRWKYDYSRKIVNVIAQRMCTAQPMKYADILELDRKAREYPEISTPPPDLNSSDSVLCLQRVVKVIHFETALFFIHHNFFILAIRENSNDPLRSRFASSFLATYSSSITILQTLRKGFQCSPGLLLRQWALWIRGLSCGVAIGSVAATNAFSELSRTALEELELVINLFEKASTHSVAKNGLPILRRLHDKAKRIRGSATETATHVKTEEVDEALKMIGGTTRSVRQMRRSFSSLATGNSVALPPRAAQFIPDNTSSLSAQGSDGAPTCTLTMEGPRHDTFDWGIQIPTNNYSSANYPAAMDLNDASLFTTGSVTRSDLEQPSASAMDLNMNLDDFEFSYGGAQHIDDGFFLNTQWNQQSGNAVDTIEDFWRTILEDPRLTDTGINETISQF